MFFFDNFKPNKFFSYRMYLKNDSQICSTRFHRNKFDISRALALQCMYIGHLSENKHTGDNHHKTRRRHVGDSHF